MSELIEAVARGVTPAQEIEDLIAEAIGDSLDVDWTPRDAARAVMRALVDEGMAIVEVPPPFNRVDELSAQFKASDKFCPASFDGLHHVDTSMEIGPYNCFHCERPM